MDTTKIVKIETEGTKELHEVGVAVGKLMSEIKKANADGFQAGMDIPAVLMGTFTELSTAIEGLDQVDDEVKAHPTKAIMGALIPITEGIESLLQKSE